MPAAQPQPSSHPYLAMGLTFLLLGVGFANPFPLVHAFPRGMWEGEISRETLNLYALTAFLGWGHFFYAWQGQARSSARLPKARRIAYWLAVALLLFLLVWVRHFAGAAIFSLVAWVYNIAHFIKAERFFAASNSPQITERAPGFYMPVVAFAWFTLVLFRVGPLASPEVVFFGSVVLAASALLLGDWRALASGEVKLSLLTLFLLGETLVWSAYGPTPAFAVGVYVMHIAAASFFHYLGGYFFAQRGTETPSLLRAPAIIAVNLMFIALGCATAQCSVLRPLRFVFAPEWFTLWVALHLTASDLLPWWKRQASPLSAA